MSDPRTRQDKLVHLVDCQRCRKPVLFTDRDNTLGDAQGPMTLWPIHADPVALAPAEEAACVILGRHVYLLEATGAQRLTISYQHHRRPVSSSARRELGRVPHHACGRPIGNTPIAFPARERNEACACLTDPDALKCAPPF